MRKLAIVAASISALAAAPTLLGASEARANDGLSFLGGVLLGGALASRPPVYVAPPPPVYVAPPPPVYVAPPPPTPVYGGGYPPAHYNWCAAKYRSYDPGTNSFQPYGPYPRRQCISPYM
ncbi:MAG: BA14K family protein [Salaquimonas sp.]|jgi:hypothetical protein|nr:BA14K family protein [Salaquimonas sp.]